MSDPINWQNEQLEKAAASTVDARIKLSLAGMQQRLAASARRSSHLHGQLLDQRRNSLHQMATLIEMQIGVMSSSQEPVPSSRPVLFNRAALEEFATGSMARCLGPEFLIFEGRRIPRIPNGDLLLMSRVMNIEGKRQDLKHPAAITTEYDVPRDAWFFQTGPHTPYSILMEMALQPCGFLSAYLGSSLLFPDQNYYFRNLDGQATLGSYPDLGGRTVTCQARMLSSVANDATIIQKFSFALACQGEVFYQGESTFGYFTPEAMSRQVGLDSGRAVAPWLDTSPGLTVDTLDLSTQQANPRFYQAGYGLNYGPLAYIQEAKFSPGGGRYQKGYIFASKEVDGNDWFYRCHFFQDPVMPGSLGVEAVLQAMHAYVLEYNLGQGFTSPHFSLPTRQPMTWKYRGQITPANQRMTLEIHVKKILSRTGQIHVEGDASVWSDQIRIYELKNIGIIVTEGQ